MDIFKELGNKRVNRYYEARLTDDYQRPKATDDYGMVRDRIPILVNHFAPDLCFLFQEKFIREKYEKKRWAAKVLSFFFFWFLGLSCNPDLSA